MDFIFDDDDATVIRIVNNQLVGRLKLDTFAIALELGHQIGPSLDNTRPTGELVENLVNHAVFDDVEEVLALDKVAQRPSNQLKIRPGGLVGSVLRIWHYDLSMRFAKSTTLSICHCKRGLGAPNLCLNEAEE